MTQSNQNVSLDYDAIVVGAGIAGLYQLYLSLIHI